MISPSRIRQLRIADIRARLNSKLRLCRDVINGSHEALRLVGAMRWLDAHPGKSYDDFVAWREEVKAIACALHASIERRIARIDRIAASGGG